MMPAGRSGSRPFYSFFLIFLVTCLLASCLAGCFGGKSWRKGGVPGSRPYTVGGKTYHPLKSAHGFVEEGIASWYGPGFHGKKTASGETYNQNAMTAAHKILPLGTTVRVTNLANRRSVIVRINDRGPFVADRVIDLSRTAANKLGITGKGTGRVRIQSVGDVARMEQGGQIDGDYYVQVGAFANKSNAGKLVSRLSGMGHRGRLVYGNNRMWNVQAGPWPDSARAQRMLDLFRNLYPQAFVVGGN